jgi:hypothetical protein
MTNIIKLRFLRNGKAYGKEYCYLTNEPVMVGDIVEVDSRDGRAKGIVTQIDVPEEAIAAYRDIAKTIIGRVPGQNAETTLF